MTVRWVLLRGLAREAGHWGTFPGRLAATAGGEVLTLDLPGAGRRWRERSPPDVPALARDVIAQLPAGEGTVLVALSLGAMVALECCRQQPGAFAGCVVINTSAGGLAPFWRRLRPLQYPTLARLLWAGLAPERREEIVLAMTSADPGRHADAAAHWAALARARPISVGNALRQVLAAARWRVPPGAPAVPLLLLASAADRLVHPGCSRRLAQQWQVPLREHPWAGHDLPLDAPDWVLAQVVAWAAQVRGH